MKNDAIRHAVREMADAVTGTRIQKIRLLDSHTLIIDLYGRNGLFVLAVSLNRRDRGFHLLFEKIHGAYLYRSPASQQLYALVRGFRVQQMQHAEQYVLMKIRSSAVCYLFFDFKAFDIFVLDEGGGIVFRFFKYGIEADTSVFRLIAGPVKGNEDSEAGGTGPGIYSESGSPESEKTPQLGELPLNRDLSKEFFTKRSLSLVRGTLKVIKGESKKVVRLLEKLHLEEQEIENSEAIRHRGELLKYNLSKVRKGATSVTLGDFDGNDVEIVLDPACSPVENMNRYFKRYKKLGRKREVFEKKCAYETGRHAALDRLLRHVSDKKNISLKTPPSALLDLLQGEYFRESFRRRVGKALVQRPAGRPMKREEKKEGFLRLTSRTGKIILVGRNARENEELAIRKARGNDLWFHVEDGTGSAVVLRYDRKGEFQESDIDDASALALYFSKARGQGAGSVVYTFCKHLNKPKGSKPGYVIYHKNKSRYTVLEEKVLAQLIDSKIPIGKVGLKLNKR